MTLVAADAVPGWCYGHAVVTSCADESAFGGCYVAAVNWAARLREWRLRRLLRRDTDLRWAAFIGASQAKSSLAITLGNDIYLDQEFRRDEVVDALLPFAASRPSIFVDLLGTPSNELATSVITRVGHPATSALVAALGDRHRVLTAIDLLASIGGEEVLRALSDVVRSGEPNEVRVHAANAIASLRLPAAIDLLADLARTGDAEMKLAAARGLASVQDQRAIPHLRAMLADSVGRPYASQFITSYPGVSGVARDLEKVIRVEPGDYAARSAAQALQHFGTEGVEVLLRLANDGNHRIREAAYIGLEPSYPGEVTDDRIIRTLVAGIERPGDMGRVRAAGALRSAKCRLAADLLLPLLDHPDPEVRASAASAIWVHKDDDVVEALLRRLAVEPDPQARANAVYGLCIASAPGAKAAVENAAANDPDERVRGSASSALSRWDRDYSKP